MTRMSFNPKKKKKVKSSVQRRRKLFIPTDDQSKVLSVLSDESVRAVWARGGLGSGKTILGAHWVCDRIKNNQAARALITACSYPQLERSTLVGLAHYCRNYGVQLEPLGSSDEQTGRLIASRRHCYIHGRYVYVVSADSFYGGAETARGMEIRICWADELAYYAEAFDTLNGRLGRGPGEGAKIFITSSINKHYPYNRLWEIFDDPERINPQYQSVKMRSADNPYLDSGYVSALQASYSDDQIRIELDGDYATMAEGRVFNFHRTLHFITDPQVSDYARHRRLVLSFDFNYSPSTCLVGLESEEFIYVLKEFYIQNCGTWKLAEIVLQFLQDNNVAEVDLFGDASGRARTANSQKTNWDIINSTFRAAHIRFYRRYRDSNPSIVDSVNYTNSLFKKNQLLISSNCTELIKDLETCCWNENNKLDKSDLKRGHLSDCLRYMTWERSPLYYRDYIPKSSFV